MPGFLITGNEGQLAPQSTTETARAYRWEVWVYSTNTNHNTLNEIRFYAKSVTRPTIETDKITLHHRSNELYLPGKSRPGQCTLVLYERVDNKDVTAEIVRNWWSSWMMDVKNYALNLDNKNNVAGTKVSMDIQLLDGYGNITWTYFLKGVFPLKVEPSELDYSVSDISTLQVTLSVDAFAEGQYSQ